MRVPNGTPGFCSDAHKQEAYRLRRALPTADDLLLVLYPGKKPTPEALLRDRARYLNREIRARLIYAANQFLLSLGDAYEASWPGSGHAMRPVLRKRPAKVPEATPKG